MAGTQALAFQPLARASQVALQGVVSSEILQQEQFGVDLPQPVDLYQQVERATRAVAMVLTRRIDWYQAA